MKRMATNPGWFAIATFVMSLTASSAVHAQSDYPNKPVRIINDSAAGSSNDATARILVDKLSHIWGQQVLTINQPGAGGGISAKAASQSPNDGYTLYLPATSPFLTLPGASGVSPNLPLELPRDFTPIGFMLQQPLFIGASHKSGITSLPQLIEMAKAKPGEITYAATGRGRLTHLTMELFQARTGTKLQLVPYAGGNGAGDERCAKRAGSSHPRRVRWPRRRAEGRSDQGTGRYVARTTAGLRESADDRGDGARLLRRRLGRAGRAGRHADAIVRKVNADLWTALNDPDVKTKYQANGAFLRYMKPEQVTEFVQEQQKTWRPILEQVARETQK